MNSTDLKIKDVIAKAFDLQMISEYDAKLLANPVKYLLKDICEAAAHIRNIGKGNVITFSPKVFIPLTRLCRDYCGYCTFRVEPSEINNIYMSPDEVLDVAKKGAALGCTEALFTLGERPEIKYKEAKQWLNSNGYESTIEYLTDMTEMVLNETQMLPHANPGTLTKREMLSLKPYNASSGLMLESTSELLYQKGGAHEYAPSKRPIVRLKTINLAGELKVPFTTGLLIGIGESPEDRIESLLEIRRSNESYGHVQEIIIQNFRAKPSTPMSDFPDAVTNDMLWTVAVARIILGPSVNIQVPPNLSYNNYQVYIDAGINDWGGVSPLTIDYVNPEAPWPLINDLKNKTEAKGFELKPRLTVYPEFFVNNKSFLPDKLHEKVSSLADENGYVKWGINRYI
jgi:7,8-didemethyl-8-hydroxy-5-deazariboflavin synthase CofG subunit